MSRRTITVGRSYEVSTGRDAAPRVVRVVRYDPVDRTHVVRAEGSTAETRLDFRRVSGEVRRVSAPSKKTDTSQVYLYLCAIGSGHYKLGASSDPERRRKQIRTHAPKAVMRATVPLRHGAAFRRCEKAVLSKFRTPSGSGGTEVLRLTPEQVGECVRAMRHAATVGGK